MRQNTAAIVQLHGAHGHTGTQVGALSQNGPQNDQKSGAQSTQAAAQTSPVQRIFAHWVLMMGKTPARCALGPTRQKAIAKALAMYPEDTAEETLLLAIEGCACDPWHAGQNDRNKPFQDIELILRDEAHIERFADAGEVFRAQVEQAEAAKLKALIAANNAANQAPPQNHPQAPDNAVVQAARAKLAALRAQMAATMRVR